AFHSSKAGSDNTPASANESYDVVLGDPDTQGILTAAGRAALEDAHGGAVDLFSKVVECNDPVPRVTGASPNLVSLLFRLDRLLGGRALFGPQAGFEASIQGTKIATEGDSVARWEPLSLRPIPTPAIPPKYFSV